MEKENLPVVLLNNIVLLPNNDVRLEFDNNNISKNIIDVADMFFNNKIFIVSENSSLSFPDLKKLPHMGVVASITHKMEAPDGKVRVILSGLYRASVIEYLNINNVTDILKAEVKMTESYMDKTSEKTLINKLFKELDGYLKMIPYASSNLLSLVLDIKDASVIADITAPQLPLPIERQYEYLYTVSKEKRIEMLLEDIYREKDIIDLENNIDSKVKKEIDATQKEYLLREKIKVIKKELGEASIKDDDVDVLKEKIEQLKAPEKIKDRLAREIKKYESLPTMSPELNIVRNYIDWILDLPWDNYTDDNQDLKNARDKLDSSHYGLEQVKTRIIEFLAVKQQTNNLKSPILCLVGAPGVGKTSLAIGIAEAIDRKFVKISVGGVNDEAELVGHRRTYIGANPGRIIQGMKKAGCNNPVFLIDEIDKMTKDYKGDPASALLEILDPEQNKFFSDNYIEEDYDLSNVMFIATANYIDDIPEALKDRLEIVQLSGYTEYEKLDIAKRHLLPKVCTNHGLDMKKITISDEIILKIIREYTKEAGVRELERQLSNIVRKIVTSIVVEENKQVKFTVTKNNIITYLGKAKYHFSKKSESKIGVVNGLAYTYFGGDTLPIEVNFYPGSGKLSLTGSLGDVMKESAQIALSYVKANHKLLKIDYNIMASNDIHIHVPEGAIRKDGPSAGVALTTALLSALANLEVSRDVAMTGEITLRGDILPIGGLKEKSIGAHRNGIKTIFIPYDNLNDLDDIPKEIKETIEYIPVKKYSDIYKHLINAKKD